MEASAPMTVVTIGYEGRQLDEFIAELVGRRVEVVFDVRENAISRKPGFSKRRLGEALAVAGIEYRHLSSLGNPRSNRDAFRAGEPAARDVFLRHLDDGSRRGARRGRWRGPIADRRAHVLRAGPRHLPPVVHRRSAGGGQPDAASRAGLIVNPAADSRARARRSGTDR